MRNHELRWYRAQSVLGKGRFYICLKEERTMSYQTPRGTYDILPDEMNRWHHTEEVIRETTKRYRYREIRTPYFEETKVFIVN